MSATAVKCSKCSTNYTQEDLNRLPTRSHTIGAGISVVWFDCPHCGTALNAIKRGDKIQTQAETRGYLRGLGVVAEPEAPEVAAGGPANSQHQKDATTSPVAQAFVDGSWDNCLARAWMVELAATFHITAEREDLTQSNFLEVLREIQTAVFQTINNLGGGFSRRKRGTPTIKSE